MKGKQVAQGVDGRVHLRAALAPGPVIARAVPALGRGAERPAVQDRRRRLGATARLQPQQHPKVVHDRLEDTRRQPPPRLGVDNIPWRQVVGHPAPGRARLDHVAQPVEHLAQLMPPLPRSLWQQHKVGRNQRPFLIRHVGGIGFASHARNLALPSVHNSL